jgi:probable F420-dependent oxidoreductase
MRVGLYLFPTDVGIQPIEMAKEAEARGFDALWFPEHSHIPVSRRTPWGGRVNAPELPAEYWRTHDQFIALTAAAAVTTTIKLGTGITLVAQRDPLWLAKEVASLDVISGGRFLFGVGYGWNHEEMESHGTDIHHRRAVVREKVLACKELWTKDEASFAGKYVNFDPMMAWPKPVQKPHPPIIIGAAPTDLHFRHIVEYADGWMPIEGRWPIADQWNTLKNMAADAGRDPASLTLGTYSTPPTMAHIAGLRDIGATMVALMVPPLDRDAALATLDSYAPLVAEFNAAS